MNSNGGYVFTPDEYLFGVFEFVYQVCDTQDNCATAVLTVTIEELSGDNFPPVTQNITADICEGAGWIFDIDDVISDVETPNENLIVQIVSGEYFVIEPNTHILSFSSNSLPPGLYTATYEVCDNGDPMLCQQSQITLEVLALNNVFAEEIYVEYVSCYGDNDGSIEIISVSGLGNISYVWEGGGTSNQLNNLEADDYLVQLSSDASCSVGSTSLITVSGPSSPLTASVDSFGNIDEGNDGHIQLIIEGGSEPYSVEWIGPSGFFSFETNLDGLNEAGLYTANISDGNGCETQLGLSLVGVEEYKVFYTMNVMPNPSQGMFTLNLRGAANKSVTYTLFDGQGRAILKGNPIIATSTYSSEIDASSFASGIYHLQVIIGDHIETIKVIIE